MYRGGRVVDKTGQVFLTVHGHPRSTKDGYVPEHVLVVEKAIGRHIEGKHPIHHHNENRSDNSNQNLVVCEDPTYHLLLHYRSKIVRHGGDPDREKYCTHCEKIRPRSDFYKKASKQFDGLSHICKYCRHNMERPNRSNPYKSVIEPSVVFRVRALWDAGIGSAEIARQTGLTRSNCRLIGLRKTWKDLV